MTRSDRELSRALKAEMELIVVPAQPRGRGRTSVWASPAALVVGAGVIVAGLALGCAVSELRAPMPAATAPAPSPAVTAQPSAAGLVPDRYGLVLDRQPPVMRSEADSGQITALRGEFSSGAVSPDGRRFAYWQTPAGPARRLWLLETSAPTQPRSLLTLPDSEIAATSTGSAVAWSSDGTGLLIAVNGLAPAREGPPIDAPLYATLRQIDVATGAVREIARTEMAAWFSPVAWDRARGVSTAVAIGPGESPGSYGVLRDGVAPLWAPLPAGTLAVFVRAAPDAGRVLMRGFPDHRAVYVWPLTDVTNVTTLGAVGDEYVAAAMWRDAREIVVSLSRTSVARDGERLEVWALEGPRRVLLRERHGLDVVRPDGTAAITDKGVIDLATGAREELPGMRGDRATASLLLH